MNISNIINIFTKETIVLEIFSFLKFKDLLKFQLLSKDIFICIRKNDILWNNIGQKKNWRDLVKHGRSSIVWRKLLVFRKCLLKLPQKQKGYDLLSLKKISNNICVLRIKLINKPITYACYDALYNNKLSIPIQALEVLYITSINDMNNDSTNKFTLPGDLVCAHIRDNNGNDILNIYMLQLPAVTVANNISREDSGGGDGDPQREGYKHSIYNPQNISLFWSKIGCVKLPKIDKINKLTSIHILKKKNKYYYEIWIALGYTNGIFEICYCILPLNDDKFIVKYRNYNDSLYYNIDNINDISKCIKTDIHLINLISETDNETFQKLIVLVSCNISSKWGFWIIEKNNNILNIININIEKSIRIKNIQYCDQNNTFIGTKSLSDKDILYYQKTINHEPDKLIIGYIYPIFDKNDFTLKVITGDYEPKSGASMITSLWPLGSRWAFVGFSLSIIEWTKKNDKYLDVKLIRNLTSAGFLNIFRFF
eukprot:GHVL01005273.1.p1 GENE.GHVL01005273.1~~GHVL01005273.1.p1  ORF type:complete len:482 (+),score=143.57 GHVL01005273.1:103-1548(+)